MYKGRIMLRAYLGLRTYAILVAFAAVLMCILLSLGCRSTNAKSAGAVRRESKAEMTRDERMEWWREARFGMFIHWGLYAVPAGQWKGKKIDGIGEWIMNSAQIPVDEYERLAREV